MRWRNRLRDSPRLNLYLDVSVAMVTKAPVTRDNLREVGPKLNNVEIDVRDFTRRDGFMYYVSFQTDEIFWGIRFYTNEIN